MVCLGHINARALSLPTYGHLTSHVNVDRSQGNERECDHRLDLLSDLELGGLLVCRIKNLGWMAPEALEKLLFRLKIWGAIWMNPIWFIHILKQLGHFKVAFFKILISNTSFGYPFRVWPQGWKICPVETP